MSLAPVIPKGKQLGKFSNTRRRSCADMALFSSEALSTGWEFKLTEGSPPDSWLPVAKVPTVVHLDLLDNKKYDLTAYNAM